MHSNPDAPFLGTNVVDNGADREHASIGEHFPSPHPAPEDDLRLLEEKLAAMKVAKRTKLYKANLRRTNLKRLAEEVAAMEVSFLGTAYSDRLCTATKNPNPSAPFLGTSVVENEVGLENASIGKTPPSPHPAPEDDLRLLVERLAAMENALRTELYKANLHRANLRSDADAAFLGISVSDNEISRRDMLQEGTLYKAVLRNTSSRSKPYAAPTTTSVNDNDVG